MGGYRQASWNEGLIYEFSRPGLVGFTPPPIDDDIRSVSERYFKHLPEEAVRDSLDLPEVSEPQVVRHFTRLSQMNYSISTGFYPLGSCTMKYNPVVNNRLAGLELASNIHPLQPEETVQGCLEILYRLERNLIALTGMARFSLAPSAGAHGELVGCLIMRAYHREKEGRERRRILVPDSAHGTNPASAAMAGFVVEEVATGRDGCVDLDSLEKAMDNDVAGLMLTNPNTLGLFERNIGRIVEIVHSYDALLYYDGANMNAIAGVVRPGDLGFDIIHLNLHKTFSTPHGGGGPGSGPVGVVERLVKYLPPPLIEYDEEKKIFRLVLDRPGSIGPVKMFYGNFGVLLRAYAYIVSMGGEGLRRAAMAAVTASNYMLSKMSRVRGVSVPYGRGQHRKHEFVLSLSRLRRETGLGALEVGKRLLDYGFHTPTIYFPLIVDEAFMVEPTETESKEELDRYVKAFEAVIEECYNTPELVRSAPHNTSVSRIDEARASHPRTLTPSWRVYRMRRLEADTTTQPP
mgnify:CR=1 FL=1